MKKILSIAVLFSLFLTSCKKDEIISTDKQVGSSRVIYFPSVQIKGEKLIILSQGQSFTEPGVTATINGQEVQYTTEGSVQTATPGVYNLTYTAKNDEGYTSSDWRTVVVIGNDVALNDFSGTYQRPGFAQSVWKKKANGVYTVDNPGGAGVGVGFKVVVVNYTGNKIKIPRQIAEDPTDGPKEVASASETYDPLAVPVTYKWVFLAGGYGTSSRTFVKIN